MLKIAVSPKEYVFGRIDTVEGSSCLTRIYIEINQSQNAAGRSSKLLPIVVMHQSYSCSQILESCLCRIFVLLVQSGNSRSNSNFDRACGIKSSGTLRSVDQ